MKNLVTFIIISSLLSCSVTDKVYREKIANHRTEAQSELTNYKAASFKSEEIIKNLDYFPANEKYACTCTFVKSDTRKMIEMPTYSGINKAFVVYGKALCKIDKDEVVLTLYKSMRTLPGYADLIFVPFKDKTNGVSTYEGGRYMDLEEHDIHMDKVIIDFNMAYNPWCAYSDGFNCPIPPSDNHLDITIKAGEKKYKGKPLKSD
ncbi:MAG: DUF1684 domain-containing protein [Saprospiraceae bacterium]|nr:DUF1684 domain-containing protein [Saprospiraceae bacterium]